MWVDNAGAADAPALLYLHGGPGVGSYEFTHYAMPALARNWRVIAFDQRGVLRSDPIPEGGVYGLDDLVADTEALRAALGIERWAVLGHSFGGHYALRYALAYPQRVERLYFENAGVSFPESTKSSIMAAADLYRQLGQNAAAAACDALLAKGESGPSLLYDSAKLITALGAHRQDLYIYDPGNRGFFQRLQAQSGLSDVRWSQGQHQAKLLIDEGKILEAMLARLPLWRGPMIMLKGQTDHVASKPEMDTVRAIGGRVFDIPRSGHFSHVEQPELFAQCVLDGRTV